MSPPCVRIVLADSQPLFRDGVRRALDAIEGFEVVAEASDGPAALERTIDTCAGLLLLDVALPGLSGLEVLRQLHERRAAVRTLLLTAAVTRDQTLEALELGARGVIAKDATADVLVKGIRAVMKGEYWVWRETLVHWKEFAEQQARRPVLTGREREIVRLLLDGLSNHAIADRLAVSEETVKTHVTHIYRKLGVSSRVKLVRAVTDGRFRLLA